MEVKRRKRRWRGEWGGDEAPVSPHFISFCLFVLLSSCRASLRHLQTSYWTVSIKQITDFTYWIRIVSHSFTVQSVQLIWATYFTNTMHSKTFLFTELFKNKMKKINWNEDLVRVMSLPAPPCVCVCVFSGTWRYFWKCIILTFILWRKKLFSCEWDVFGRFGHCWNMRKSS